MPIPPEVSLPGLPDFVRIDRGRARAWVRRGYEEHAMRLGLGGAPAADAGWARGGRAAHPIVALPGGERALVRAYLRGGAVRHLNRRRYFRGHRAVDELRATERARLGGVRTATVLAATERRGGAGYTAWLATRWIAGARDAAARLADADAALRVAVWAEAGRQIGRMHRAGVAHPDLNLRNLLVVDEPAGPAVYLLDFDRARCFAGPVPGRRRAAELRRLARSARKVGRPLDAADWDALRHGYGAEWPSGLRLP